MNDFSKQNILLNERTRWKMNDNFENKLNNFFNDCEKLTSMGFSRTKIERNEKSRTVSSLLVFC